MSLNTKLVVAVLAGLVNPLDLAAPRADLNLTKTLQLASGTGAGQADRIFHDTRTLSASGSEDLDLAGGLTDALGQAATFARVKLLMIAAAPGNANNVIVGGASSNGWITAFGGAAHTVTVRPGGLFVLAAPDATAYAVTAATGDLLKVANSAGGTSVSYDLVVVGASA